MGSWPRATEAFRRVAGLPGVRNVVVRVEAESGAVFEAAAGEARPGIPMTPAHRFHLASVGKSMTATLVLQLMEEGAFGNAGIDAPYASFEAFPPEVMARLHRRDGVSRAHAITIRHLLTHTAGIRDAMEDDAGQTGGPAPGSIIGSMFGAGGDPSRRWEPWAPGAAGDARAGVINWFLNTGIADAALNDPGVAFHYSDTGYMLLGVLLEHVTGTAFGHLCHDRLFAPLDMADTYLAYRNDPGDIGTAREPEAEFWAGAIPLLSARVNLSFDWAGGGQVSSARSLLKFQRALLSGRLFRREETLKAMKGWITPDGLKPPRKGVGLGLFRTEIEGIELVGHSGASGARMFHAPALGLYAAGTINQAEGPGDWHAAIIRACFEDLRHQ